MPVFVCIYKLKVSISRNLCVSIVLCFRAYQAVLFPVVLSQFEHFLHQQLHPKLTQRSQSC